MEKKLCLDGEDSVIDSDKYSLKSINHDMYLQKTRASTLSIFDDKKTYLDNQSSLASKSFSFVRIREV